MSKRTSLPLAVLMVGAVLALMCIPASGAGTASIGFSPATVTVQTGAVFSLTVVVNDVIDLYGLQLDASYNDEYLEFVNAEAGTMPGSDDVSTYFATPAAEAGEILHGAITRLSNDAGIDGSGTIVEVFFRALKDTTGTYVKIENPQLVDRNGQDISRSYINSGRCKVIISADAT